MSKRVLGGGVLLLATWAHAEPIPCPEVIPKVEVQAVDPMGQPIEHAQWAWAGWPEATLEDPVGATWRGCRALASPKPVWFYTRTQVVLSVTAEGWHPSWVVHEVKKGDRNRLTVSLRPITESRREPPAVPVEVKVIDREGRPIPTADIRLRGQAPSHRRGAVTPTWIGAVVYLESGQEVLFVPGLTLPFEVSAPGYRNTTVTHTVHKNRKHNMVIVEMDKMDLRLEKPGVEVRFDR